MKDFINSAFSLFGVILITLITGVAAALILEDIVISLSISAAVFILGFIGLVKQSYSNSMQNRS